MTTPITGGLLSNEQLISDAREWLKDCVWRDMDPDAIDEATPAEVLAAVERHYEDGLAAFVLSRDVPMTRCGSCFGMYEDGPAGCPNCTQAAQALIAQNDRLRQKVELPIEPGCTVEVIQRNHPDEGCKGRVRREGQRKGRFQVVLEGCPSPFGRWLDREELRVVARATHRFAEPLGRCFAYAMQQDLIFAQGLDAEGTLKEIDEVNADTSVGCACHEYLDDANTTMDRAFRMFMGRSPVNGNDDDDTLRNQAWTWAMAQGYANIVKFIEEGEVE